MRLGVAESPPPRSRAERKALDPQHDRAAEPDGAEGERLLQRRRRCRPASGRPSAAPSRRRRVKTNAQPTPSSSACSTSAARILEPAGAERAGERRGDAAAHAAIGHVHHQRDEGDDQRDAGQRIDAEPRHEPASATATTTCTRHDRGRRTGEPQQAPPDGRGEKRMGQDELRTRTHTAFRQRREERSDGWLSLAHARSVASLAADKGKRFRYVCARHKGGRHEDPDRGAELPA